MTSSNLSIISVQAKIDEYFSDCDIHEKTPTANGLAYFLGMTYEEFMNYAKDPQIHKSKDHVRIMSMAKTRLAALWEEKLAGKHNKADFWLKQMQKWDKENQDTSSQSLVINIDSDDAKL